MSDLQKELLGTQRLFHIVSAEGENYYVAAESFAEAHSKFRKWECGTDDPSEHDDVQSIQDAGYLIIDKH